MVETRIRVHAWIVIIRVIAPKVKKWPMIWLSGRQSCLDWHSIAANLMLQKAVLACVRRTRAGLLVRWLPQGLAKFWPVQRAKGKKRNPTTIYQRL